MVKRTLTEKRQRGATGRKEYKEEPRGYRPDDGRGNWKRDKGQKRRVTENRQEIGRVTEQVENVKKQFEQYNTELKQVKSEIGRKIGRMDVNRWSS